MKIDTKLIASGLQSLGWQDRDIRRTVTQLHKGFLPVSGRVIRVELVMAEHKTLTIIVWSKVEHAGIGLHLHPPGPGESWFYCWGKDLGVLYDLPSVPLPEGFDFSAIGYTAGKLATNQLVGYQKFLIKRDYYPSWAAPRRKRESTIEGSELGGSGVLEGERND